MCIAICKPMGVDLPSESILKNCWYNNNDGAGFSFALDGNVFIKKGFMTFDSFISALKSTDQRCDLKKRGMLLHFRIATHGARDATMTHPFPIHSDDGALKKIEYISDYAVIHNGIISLTSGEANRSKSLSDTAIFIQKYLTRIATNRGWFRNKENISLIEDLIDSKMAILSRNGEIKMTSGFTLDGGIYYSNSSYNDNYVREFKYSSSASYYSYGSNYQYTFQKSDTLALRTFPLMRVDIGDTLDSDCGSWEISSEADRIYYATEPKDGFSLIFQRFDNPNTYSKSAEEYFADYEYVGTGIIYGKNMIEKPWRASTHIYEDQFTGGCTPEVLETDVDDGFLSSATVNHSDDSTTVCELY